MTEMMLLVLMLMLLMLLVLMMMMMMRQPRVPITAEFTHTFTVDVELPARRCKIQR